eukprot:scaffold2361_cov390-Prasinococcus_capsulatus_cf.AAC.4
MGQGAHSQKWGSLPGLARPSTRRGEGHSGERRGRRQRARHVGDGHQGGLGAVCHKLFQEPRGAPGQIAARGALGFRFCLLRAVDKELGRLRRGGEATQTNSSDFEHNLNVAIAQAVQEPALPVAVPQLAQEAAGAHVPPGLRCVGREEEAFVRGPGAVTGREAALLAVRVQGVGHQQQGDEGGEGPIGAVGLGLGAIVEEGGGVHLRAHQPQLHGRKLLLPLPARRARERRHGGPGAVAPHGVAGARVQALGGGGRAGGLGGHGRVQRGHVEGPLELLVAVVQRVLPGHLRALRGQLEDGKVEASPQQVVAGGRVPRVAGAPLQVLEGGLGRRAQRGARRRRGTAAVGGHQQAAQRRAGRRGLRLLEQLREEGEERGLAQHHHRALPALERGEVLAREQRLQGALRRGHGGGAAHRSVKDCAAAVRVEDQGREEGRGGLHGVPHAGRARGGEHQLLAPLLHARGTRALQPLARRHRAAPADVLPVRLRGGRRPHLAAAHHQQAHYPRRRRQAPAHRPHRSGAVATDRDEGADQPQMERARRACAKATERARESARAGEIFKAP